MRDLHASQVILATLLPMGIISVEEIPSYHAIASIGSRLAALAISRSVGKAKLRLAKSLNDTVEMTSL